MDHLARALIGEEVKYMESACEELEANDIAYFAKLLEESCAKAALEKECVWEVGYYLVIFWRVYFYEEDDDDDEEFFYALVR